MDETYFGVIFYAPPDYQSLWHMPLSSPGSRTVTFGETSPALSSFRTADESQPVGAENCICGVEDKRPLCQ